MLSFARESMKYDDLGEINKQLKESKNKLKITIKNMTSALSYKEPKEDDLNGKIFNFFIRKRDIKIIRFAFKKDFISI